MIQKDLISIIVPVYNMEQYLERCMNSILCQTYRQLEIILVDDGSADRSAAMCDEYAKKDARIKVVHKQNGGLSDARNAGLKIATGAYIGYVDSDDWIEPDMYERMYQACIRQEAEVAVCRYRSVYRDREIAGGTGEETVFNREELLRIYICGHDDYIIYNSVWSKLFRRDIVEGEIFPAGRNSEDIMYTTKAFCKAKKGVYIDSCLYHYVIDREGSIMNGNRGKRMFEDELPFWREHIAYISTQVSEQLGDMAAYYFYRRLLFYYVDLRKEVSGENTSMQEYADKLVLELKKDKGIIQKIYQNPFVSKGDKIRMKIALVSPKLYEGLTRAYDKIVIPLRNRG